MLRHMDTYKNGSTLVSFGRKRRYADIYGDINAFYVIQPTMCGKPSPFIKLGRTGNLKRRFAGYARVYNGRFDILHLRVFRQSRLGTAYEEGTGKRVTDFAATFESQVKRALREAGVQPFRPDSDEIYPAESYAKIKHAIATVVNNNDRATVKVVPNRRSKRVSASVLAK